MVEIVLNSFPIWTLSQTLSEALKTLWAGSSKLQTPNLAWKVLELKKNNKAQMVDFLTKPSRKMQKKHRAKGVALETPDIKIIMYVYTPLNKVFGFQGSKFLVVEIVSQFLSYLNPLSNLFLKPSRLFELEAVHSKLQILPEKFWSWEKSTRLKLSISLLNPLEKCKKTIAQRGWPWRPLTSKQ